MIPHFSRNQGRRNAGRFFLYCLAILAVFLFSALYATGPADADSPKKQVVFVHYNLKSASSESAIIQSFKKTMASRGYLEDQNVEYVDIQTHSDDREAINEVLEATDRYKNSADIFITTSWTSLYVRSKLAGSNVPQLFVPALKSTALNMLPSVTSETGTNLSGIYLMYPPEKILRLTRLIFANITNYAYVYDSRIPADLIFKAAYNKLQGADLHGISLHYLDLADGPKTVLKKFKTLKIEAYGGVVGFFTNNEALEQSGLPVVTSLMVERNEDSIREFVRESNIVAGLFNPFDYCGEQAAEMTANIFDGKNTIDRTLPKPARQVSFVNLIAARRFDKNIPFAALEAIDIVIK